MTKRKGNVFPPGRPKGKCAPTGGSELHEVKSLGAISFTDRVAAQYLVKSAELL